MSEKSRKDSDITRPLKELPALRKDKSQPSQKGSASLGNPRILLDAVAAISTPIDVHGIAEQVARQIVRFTDADVCAVSRWNSQNDKIALWVEYRRGESSASSIPYLPYKASDYPTTKKVLVSGLPRQLHLNDPGLDKGERILMDGMNAKSLLLLPLISNDTTIGLIELFDTTSQRDFTPDEIANIQVLAEHAGISLERAQLFTDAKRQAAELEILRRASLSLTTSLEKEQIFNALLENALRLSPQALDAHIFTYQEGKLEFGASSWSTKKKGPTWKKVRKGGLTHTVASTGKVIAIEDVSTHPLYKDTEWIKGGWRGSIIGLPLKFGSELVGVMNIAYKTRQVFDENRLRLLGLLAVQAAVAIMNSRLHEMVKQQATTDSLTGLANRRAFDERLGDEIRRCNRYNHHVSLVMIDLDGFKKVNDTFGHPTGDRTLQAVARCLQAAVRDTDFLARYGGDEFALILPETTGVQAQALDAKISEAITRCEFPWSGKASSLRVSLSSGTATYPEDAIDAESLVAVADANLYCQKTKKND